MQTQADINACIDHFWAAHRSEAANAMREEIAARIPHMALWLQEAWRRGSEPRSMMNLAASVLEARDNMRDYPLGTERPH